MNAKQKELLLGLTLIPLLIGCIYLIFDARQEMKYHSCHMPLASATQNGFFIAACNEILQTDTQGTVINKASFDQLGLSPQIYSLDLKDNKLLVADMGNHAAKECNAELTECKTVFSANDDLRRPFSLHIANNKFYAADPNNNRIAVYDADYQHELYITNDFKYPNDIYIDENQLIVADTSAHRLVIFEPDNNKWHPIQTIDFKTLRGADKYTRPLSVKVDAQGNYWVIMADHLITGREIIKVSPEQTVLESFQLPENGEPFGLLVLDQHVLVTDPNNHRLYTLSASGSSSLLAEHSELTTRLDNWRQKGAWVDVKMTLGFVGAVLLIIIALLFQDKFKAAKIPATKLPATVDVDISNPKIYWIVPNNEHTKKLILILSLFIIVIVLRMLPISPDAAKDSTFVTALKTEMTFFPLPIIIPSIISLILLYQYISIKHRRLGIIDETLIFQFSKTKFVAAKIEDIEYFQSIIFIAAKPINITSQSFPGDQLAERIYPLLQKSRSLSAEEAKQKMRSFSLSGGSKHSSLAGIAIILLVAGLYLLILKKYFM